MITIVSTGPGKEECMSLEAIQAIKDCDVVVGYKLYVELIAHMIDGKETYINGMKKEVDRCNKALELALEGKKVALISGGDAGVYGMAGIMHELVLKNSTPVEIITLPGISAVNAAASVLGAPLMHDFAIISLSDLLTDWKIIENRIRCAGEGDFVIAIYNPKSKGRPHYIEVTRDILLKCKENDTPVGIVKNAKRIGERKVITTLKNMCDEDIDMSTIVIIGNSNTYIKDGKMITPRGYKY